MAIVIADRYECLESSPLTRPSLLLDGHDFEDLIFEATSNEEVDNFELFDRKRELVDLFERLDLSILYEPT